MPNTALQPTSAARVLVNDVHALLDPTHAARVLPIAAGQAICIAGLEDLIYHRIAIRAQLESCYPHSPEFLADKLRHDPGEVCQSEWYRHLCGLFAQDRPVSSAAAPSDLMPTPQRGTRSRDR